MHFRPTFAEIDLRAITHNVHEYKKVLGETANIMTVVKADGYGHGSLPVMKAAMKAGVNWAGVALIEEAIELRSEIKDLPIFLLGGWTPASIESIVEYNITPTIFNTALASELNDYARKLNKQVKVHLKVETGMGRLGFSKSQFIEFIDNIGFYEFLTIDGIYSHLSSSDEENQTFTEKQIAKFKECVAILSGKFKPSWIHICNSAATGMYHLSSSNLYRLGISLYGLPPSENLDESIQLKDALSWKTSIVQLQWYPAGSPISYGRTYKSPGKRKIATLCVGYADGYSRLLSNKGQVLIKGQRVPIVGRVCMDMIMVDVTDIEGVQLWDEVVLIGKQEEDKISATEMASWLDTINYEIVTQITKRVPRVYVGE